MVPIQVVRSAVIRTTVFLAAMLFLAQLARGAIVVQTVPVGNAGNLSDSNARGAVFYDYQIGRTEVTVTQYAAFLNAVAKADTYSLYHPNMGFEGSISRSGPSGNYNYTVVGNFTKPITYVSWFDAARFVNWLHNGQPTGTQNLGTTESGAYLLNGALTGVGFAKDVAAQFWVPSGNEWYKSAYHQPASAGGDADNYWLYPTRSNTQPNSRNGSATDPNSANYFYNDGLANGYNGGYAVNNSTSAPVDGRTVVGAFQIAPSHYGTFDQGGNVSEWTDFVSGPGREITGGSWDSTAITLSSAMSINVSQPQDEYGNVGFRIAAAPIPEPGAFGLLATSMILLARRSKNGRKQADFVSSDPRVY